MTRLLVGRSQAAFVTIDPHLLPGSLRRATLLPTGTNILPVDRPRQDRCAPTVAVFSVLEGNETQARLIAETALRAAHVVPDLRLTVFGRGAEVAGPVIRSLTAGRRVEVSVDGLLSAADVSERLSSASMFLFPRDGVSSRHGTIAAALAHGLPIVGFPGRETGHPLTEAGLALAPGPEPAALGAEIARIAREPAYAEVLGRRSLETYARYFAWEKLAETVERAVTAPHPARSD